MKSSKIKFISIGLFSVLYAILFIAFDQLLINYALRNKNEVAYQVAPKKLKEDMKKAEYTKDNIGQIIKEGSFVDSVLRDHRHHDDFYSDLKINLGNNSKNQSIWILGDSWASGIKENELRNKTLEQQISLKDISSVKLIGEGSWSPLIFNLVYRHRKNYYQEKPSKIVFFIDQTDIGDDYCRYRPNVLRSKDNKLIGVVYPKDAGGNGNVGLILGNYKAFGEEKSGIIYLFVREAQKFIASKTSIPGLNSCNYYDLLPYQNGLKKSPNGSDVKDYIAYFRSNLNNLIDEINLDSPQTQIILISHDWAQHLLNKSDKYYMSNNIKHILASVAKQNDKVFHGHVDFRSYYKNKKLSKVFKYPNDKFSHLHDYAILAEFIAYQINSR